MRHNIPWFAVALTMLATSSFAADRKQAFEDGKAYQPQNSTVAGQANSSNLNKVPMQNQSTVNSLSSLYGSNTKTAGQQKVTDCASYKSGGDPVADQDCAAVNFVKNQPGPSSTLINKKTDPIIINGKDARVNQLTIAGGSSFVQGSSNACDATEVKILPRYDTQRCEVGKEVTDHFCAPKLVVTYTLEVYSGQAGADLAYAKCAAPLLSGDLWNASEQDTTFPVTCAARGWGTGMAHITTRTGCLGGVTEVGYDASGCSAPPAPFQLLPATAAKAVCTDSARIVENCFDLDGVFQVKATVPVFIDKWDRTSCAMLDNNLDPFHGN